MQRASHVRVAQLSDPPPVEKVKTPPAATGGAKQSRSGSTASADAFAIRLRDIAQDRNTVASLIEENSRLVETSRSGSNVFRMTAAPERREYLRRLYRDAWAIYSGAFSTFARSNFEKILGAPFETFEIAVETVGWVLAPAHVQRRHRDRPATLITAEEVCDE